MSNLSPENSGPEPTMQELAASEGIEVDCLSGRPRSVSQSSVGPRAGASHERMSFDRVILSTDADTAAYGICGARPRPDPPKELMARRSNLVYVLADYSKLGLRPFHARGRLAIPWTLVTDDVAGLGQVRKFRDAGVGC